MTASKSHAYFTPKDYLEIEKISPIKPEYMPEIVLYAYRHFAMKYKEMKK